MQLLNKKLGYDSFLDCQIIYSWPGEGARGRMAIAGVRRAHVETLWRSSAWPYHRCFVLRCKGDSLFVKRGTHFLLKMEGFDSQ